MAGAQTYPSFWWGYTIDDPTPVRVATYLAFIFGPKLLLVGVALLAGNSMQRRVFIAFTSLLALAFLVQFSPEVLANHKFINMWLIVANIFAAFGLAWLWRVRGVARQPARLAAAGLALVIVTGGAIDLIPVKNQRIYEVSLTGDPLYEWVRTETRPNDIFLSDIHVVDRILLAGRRLYLGWPYFAWSAGYDVRAREQIYRELFATRSARDLVRRLQAIGIDYVAFDDGLRDRGYAPRLNEELFRAHMEAAFTDPDNRYGHLAIYRVPTNPATADTLPGAPVEYMYAGGDGITAGLFGEPRGLALDRWGAVYVVDTADRRVGRFSSSGNLLSWLGAPGADPVRFDRPTGVAVGSKGVVHVADEGRLRSFESSGASAGEWTGPDVPFADLADVAIDGADRLFVLDAGNGRVVRRDPDGTTITWGGVGGADGQLRDPTGLAVGAGKVAVADVGNARLVLFDDAGRFLQAWPVPEWQGHAAYGADVAIDAAGTIRASSPGTNAVLVFRPDGTLAGTLTPSGADALDGPTGLVGTPGGHLFVANARSGRVVLLVHPNP
jgi:DNA-binding beta-propeller fold protein YncE